MYLMSPGSYNVPLPDDRTAIACLYCGKTIETARKALSITCKFCHRPLRLEDVQIKQYEARRSIDTCGIVAATRRAAPTVMPWAASLSACAARGAPRPR